MALVYFQDIRLEQRVMRDASKGNTVVGQYMCVELEVLSDLGGLLGLEPAAQDCQGPLWPHLLRSARIAMCHWHVVSHLIEGKRKPDEVCSHRLKAVSFGIKADHGGLVEACSQLRKF